MNTVWKLAAAALISGVFAPTAFAAACVTGTEGDFTYRGDTATQCELQESANDGNPLDAFGQEWEQLAKFNGDQDSMPGDIFAGFTLPFGAGEITFSLQYNGLVGGWYEYELLTNDDPDTVLPAFMDLVGVVKQSNDYQAYLFESALVGDTGNVGTFRSLFGPNASGDFSHFSIYGGNYVPCTDTDPDCGGGGGSVPEPATLALVGLSLLGLAAVRRRKHS